MSGSAISAPDRAKYVDHPQVIHSYLWVDKPPIVFQAQVNEPSGVTYPITASINFDNVSVGAIADVQIDMLIVFGTTAGADDLGRTRVKGSGASTIGIPRISQGTIDGTVTITNNTYITVYDTYPPAPKLPFFDEPTGTFFKDGDLVFVANMPPVVNMDGYSHIYFDMADPSTDILTLTITSASSFSPSGATLTTRLWNVEDGTITVGTTASTAITVEFPVGRRVITLSITDSNSRATIRHLIIVAGKFGDASYAPITDAVAGPLVQTVEGLKQSFKFGQDIPATTYLDGMAVCYSQREFYDGVEGALNSTNVVKFAGWHHTDPTRIAAQQNYLLTEVTLDCLDTAGKLATFPGFPQTIESEASPLRWEQMASPNLDKFLAYLWLYHSTAAQLVNFDWSGTTTTYPFFRLNSLGNSLYGQIDGRARAIGYRLLSDRAGKCTVKKDPMLFDTGDRSSTNTISLTESDIASITYTHQRPPRSHWNRGNAVVASSSAVTAAFCIAPGIVPSWGLSASDFGENLVASQTELNTRVGNAYQRENAPESYVEVELLQGGDIYYEPLDFVRITLSSTYAAQRGLTWTTQRFMIVAITTDYDPVYGTQRRRLTLEKEVFGTPATTVVPPPNLLPDFPVVTEVYPADESTECDDSGSLNSCLGTMGAVLSDGNFARTTTWQTPAASGGPDWSSVSMGVSGTVFAYAVDPYSTLYLGTGSTVDIWVATAVGIYKVSDVFGSISGSLQYSWTTTPLWATIDASIAQQNWLVATAYYGSTGGHTGTWSTYTTDGTNWAAEAQITAHYQNPAQVGQIPCVASQTVAGTAYTVAYTTTYNGGDALASLYKTTNHGANWTQVTTPSGFDPEHLQLGGIHLPYADESIVYLPGFDTSLASGAWERLQRLNADGTLSDVTPQFSGRDYTGYFPRSMSSSPTNRQRVVLAGANSPGSFVIFSSQNAGDSWTAINPTDDYQFAAVSGDNPNVCYFGGSSGAIGYSQDFCATIEDRSGDLSTSARVLGLVGG